MTVREAIKELQKVPDKDKDTVVFIDCPHCGRGAQLAKVYEAVVLASKEKKL